MMDKVFTADGVAKNLTSRSFVVTTKSRIQFMVTFTVQDPKADLSKEISGITDKLEQGIQFQTPFEVPPHVNIFKM